MSNAQRKVNAGEKLTRSESAALATEFNRLNALIATAKRTQAGGKPLTPEQAVVKNYDISCEIKRQKIGRNENAVFSFWGHIQFTVDMTITENGKTKGKRSISKRYREFRAWHEKLEKEFRHANLPQFPSKIWFGNFDSDKIWKRQEMLALYLTAILATFGDQYIVTEFIAQ